MGLFNCSDMFNFEIFILIIILITCVVWAWLHEGRDLQRSEVSEPWSLDHRLCELPEVGAENRIQVFWKSAVWPSYPLSHLSCSDMLNF